VSYSLTLLCISDNDMRLAMEILEDELNTLSEVLDIFSLNMKIENCTGSSRY